MQTVCTSEVIKLYLHMRPPCTVLQIVGLCAAEVVCSRRGQASCAAQERTLSAALTLLVAPLQSIADRVKLHGDRQSPPEAVKHVAEAIEQLGIADKHSEE